MEVHVLIFEHRDGRDITVHASRQRAVAVLGRIVRDGWAEARECDGFLPASPPDSDAEAIESYFAAQEEESYEIAECRVGGLPTRRRLCLPLAGVAEEEGKGGTRWMSSR